MKFSKKRYSFIRFAPSGAADHRQAVERSETPVNEQAVNPQHTMCNDIAKLRKGRQTTGRRWSAAKPLHTGSGTHVNGQTPENQSPNA